MNRWCIEFALKMGLGSKQYGECLKFDKLFLGVGGFGCNSGGGPRFWIGSKGCRGKSRGGLCGVFANLRKGKYGSFAHMLLNQLV